MHEELMETQEQEKSLAEYIDVFKRRKFQFFVTLLSVLIIGLIISIGLPAYYQSKAVILIEQQEIPQDLVRSTVTGYANQRVQIISQRVMTTTNLSQIIDKYNLYAEEREDDPLEVVLFDMREDIAMDMINADVVDPATGRAAKATIAFSLAYENRSPSLAQKVANELVSLFLNENLKDRTQTAMEATNFLADEAERLSKQVSGLESKLATFKEEHADALPELADLNQQFMNRTESEIDRVEEQMQNLKERRIYLQSELSQQDPTENKSSPSRILSPSERLEALETEYISLTSRYSADHPDVISVKKEIAALEMEVGSGKTKSQLAIDLADAKANLATLQEKYSSDHPDVKRQQRVVDSLQASYDKAPRTKKVDPDETIDNPIYVQLKSELDATAIELASLQGRQQKLRDKLQDYEDRIIQAPQVEREYRELLRNYQNDLAKYQEIKAKQMEAEVAQSLESENKSERLTLIEPPLLPEKPAKPNRWALALLSVILSIVAGFGLVMLLDALDDNVYGRKGVERLLGTAPLAVVPYMETSTEKSTRYMKYVVIIAVAVVMVLIALFLFNQFVKPLDVLWFSLGRRIGIT